MNYDPVMCMVVPGSKTMDASWKAWSLYIDGKFVKAFNSEMPPIKEAKEYMKKNYPGKVAKLSRNTGASSGYVISAKDSNTTDSKAIDKAIKMCDVNKEEGFKIYNAFVRNDTLYIEYEDLLYGRGKKEKMSFTKTEAKKLLNDPWNTWLGTSKMVVKQFVG